MKRTLIAMLLAGVVFGAVVSVASTREAEADVYTDVVNACKNNWSLCITAGLTAYSVSKSLWNWIDDQLLDVSYVEECLGEGCFTEEVRETYAMYKEEAINEGGDSYEEIKETTFHEDQRNSLNDRQENAFVLVMLKDFQNRGWKVRAQDIKKAGG